MSGLPGVEVVIEPDVVGTIFPIEVLEYGKQKLEIYLSVVKCVASLAHHITTIVCV